MKIIGISGLHNSVLFKKRRFPSLPPQEHRIAQGFDSAAALVSSRGIEAAAAEERFVREKGTNTFPVNAIRYCLESARLKPQNVDYLAHGFSYEPVKSSFERNDLTRAQYEEIYAPGLQLQYLETHFPSIEWAKKFVSVPHHIAHAASTFYLSGFDEALILISDGMGEIHSMTALVGNKSKMEIIKQVPAFHSLGLFYGVLTLYLGFSFGLDEYKVMGLAPYGDSRRYFSRMMDFIHLKDDGTYAIPLFGHNVSDEDKETLQGVLRVLAETFGPLRSPESEITQHQMDIAAGLQAVLQSCQLHLLRCLKRETGQTSLCMAGGVALNCTVNGVIKRSRLFKNMFIQPAAGDDGSALGAALYIQRLNEPERAPAKMTLPLWGPEYDDNTLERMLVHQTEVSHVYIQGFQELAQHIAQRLVEGQIIAWFQGRMEFGPRALGNRSILADPRASDMRDRINAMVKKRENFRPFAPAVLAEAASEYFAIEKRDSDSYAHMLYVTHVRPQYRSQLPAITHIDGSARVQTVDRDHNRRFWTLIEAFGKLTGLPIVLNTSFNVRGQPIVCTPQEAIDTFLLANLDALVLGNHVLVRKKRLGQP